MSLSRSDKLWIRKALREELSKLFSALQDGPVEHIGGTTSATHVADITEEDGAFVERRRHRRRVGF